MEGHRVGMSLPMGFCLCSVYSCSLRFVFVECQWLFSCFIDGSGMVSSFLEALTHLLGMPLVVCLVGVYGSESDELAVRYVLEDKFWMA